eukprot:TRINITY_DN1989_c0_g1_i1.p1 TRINITY_DN1989_c0_g1~~TRINITY_DN1989_c0_g1_i1.p1  ORF type:complete len:502 (+),score=187.30 TRINITY_DN1989_c0_g1_i1:191-1696(+)
MADGDFQSSAPPAWEQPGSSTTETSTTNFDANKPASTTVEMETNPSYSNNDSSSKLDKIRQEVRENQDNIKNMKPRHSYLAMFIGQYAATYIGLGILLLVGAGILVFGVITVGKDQGPGFAMIISGALNIILGFLAFYGNWEIVKRMQDMLNMQCNLAEAQVGMLEVMEVENNRFQENNRQFEASLAESQAQNEERAQQLEVFKDQVEGLTAQNDEFKRQNEELAENLDVMKQQNEAMKENLDQLSTERQKFEEQNGKFANNLEEQDKLNADLRSQLEESRAQNEQLKASVAQLEENLDEMKEQNDRFKAENDTFHQNNEELKGTVDQLAANAEAERKEFEKMQARAQEAYNVAARSFQALDTGNERLQGLLGEMDETNAQSKEHMNSLLEVLSGLAETKEELKLITEQNKALAEKNEELSHRLMEIIDRMENIEVANKMQTLITRVDALADGGVRDTLKEGKALDAKQRQELYELLEQIDEQMDVFQEMDRIKALAQVQG